MIYRFFQFILPIITNKFSEQTNLLLATLCDIIYDRLEQFLYDSCNLLTQHNRVSVGRETQ